MSKVYTVRLIDDTDAIFDNLQAAEDFAAINYHYDPLITQYELLSTAVQFYQNRISEDNERKEKRQKQKAERDQQL